MNARRTGLLAAVCILAACSDEKPIDLGEGIGQQGSGLVAFSGSWDGYAEGYSFSDGKDRVRLTINADGVGTLQVGDSPERGVPPANVGYSEAERDATVTLKPGFAYPFAGASVESDRLRAKVESNHYFAAWCATLKPLAYSNGAHGCSAEGPRGSSLVLDGLGKCWYSTPADPTQPDSPSEVIPGTEVPCAVAYCGSVCGCDAQGCHAKLLVNPTDGGVVTPLPDAGWTYPYRGDDVALRYVSLDGALEDDGAKLVGTLVLDSTGTSSYFGLAPERVTVRLNRQ